jgi:hypothetical protein
MGGIWLLLSILTVAEVTFPMQEFLSWISFSHAGLQGGVLGALGGIAGKGIFAGSVCRLMDIKMKNKKKHPAAGQKKVKWTLHLGAAVAGIGLAWILFNFFTWNNGPIYSVIGLIAGWGALWAIQADGYFVSLVRSFWRFEEVRHGRSMAYGMVAGFFLAVPGSFVAGPLWGYLLGFPMLVIGLIWGKSRLAKKLRQAKFLVILVLLTAGFFDQRVLAMGLETLRDVSLTYTLFIGLTSWMAATTAAATVFTSKDSREDGSVDDQFHPTGSYRMGVDKNVGTTLFMGDPGQRFRVWMEEETEDGTWIYRPALDKSITLYLSTTVPGLRLVQETSESTEPGVLWRIMLERDWTGEHGVVAFKCQQGDHALYSRMLFHLAGKMSESALEAE